MFTQTALFPGIVAAVVVFCRIIDMKSKFLCGCANLLLTRYFQVLLDHLIYCPPWKNKDLSPIFSSIVHCGIMFYKKLRINLTNATYAHVIYYWVGWKRVICPHTHRPITLFRSSTVLCLENRRQWMLSENACCLDSAILHEGTAG